MKKLDFDKFFEDTKINERVVVEVLDESVKIYGNKSFDCNFLKFKGGVVWLKDFKYITTKHDDAKMIRSSCEFGIHYKDISLLQYPSS